MQDRNVTSVRPDIHAVVFPYCFQPWRQDPFIKPHRRVGRVGFYPHVAVSVIRNEWGAVKGAVYFFRVDTSQRILSITHRVQRGCTSRPITRTRTTFIFFIECVQDQFCIPERSDPRYAVCNEIHFVCPLSSPGDGLQDFSSAVADGSSGCRTAAQRFCVSE